MRRLLRPLTRRHATCAWLRSYAAQRLGAIATVIYRGSHRLAFAAHPSPARLAPRTTGALSYFKGHDSLKDCWMSSEHPRASMALPGSDDMLSAPSFRAGHRARKCLRPATVRPPRRL